TGRRVGRARAIGRFYSFSGMGGSMFRLGSALTFFRTTAAMDRNQAKIWSISMKTLGAPQILSESQLQAFVEDGFVVVRQLLRPDESETLRETFMGMAKDGPVPGLSDMSRTMTPDDPLASYPRM